MIPHPQRTLGTVLLALALSPGALAAACSHDGGGPVPGDVAPGGACSKANDCYCWQCVCQGVSGAPGQAQLCVSGTCPTGEDACAMSCSLAGAQVASATSVGACDGVP